MNKENGKKKKVTSIKEILDHVITACKILSDASPSNCLRPAVACRNIIGTIQFKGMLNISIHVYFSRKRTFLPQF